MTPRLSITTKLFLTFLAILVLALGGLGGVSTWWFIRQQSAALDQFLEAEVQGISNRLEGILEGLALHASHDPEAVRQALKENLDGYLLQRVNRPIPYKTTLVILDDQDQVLALSNAALNLQNPISRPPAGEAVLEDVRGPGPSYRVATASFDLGGGRRGTFRIACLLSGQDTPVTSFLTTLGLLLGGSLVLLSLLGAGLIQLTLGPVRTMAEAAGMISEHNLSKRIPLPPGRDDLAQLAGTLNGLLARLEADYAFQERLVEDLTHQLKTPLTILRGRNELGLTGTRSASELRELVEDNLSDIDALVNLLNTLLELARLDGRIDRLQTKPVDLASLIPSLGEELTPLWHSKDLNFHAQGPTLLADADPDALRQILTNLFDNAWKYSPRGGSVVATWQPVGDQVRLVVRNQGLPIPEADLEKIFRRFYRSEPGNHGIPGAGLGLSIVRSLVELHGGSIRAFTPPEGGAAFEIQLSRSKEPA